jgi:hypothetical protein
MKFKISFETAAQSLARWENIKQRGISRFVFFRGVLGWGLSCGVIALAIFAITHRPLPVLKVVGGFLVMGLA